jgi:adenine-specific DNA-methyltransferase
MMRFRENKYELIKGDAYKVLKSLDSNQYKLIITSPPYNTGKEYETYQSISEYLVSQKKIISELSRVLNNNGSICWQVGNHIDRKSKEVFPLDIFYYEFFKKEGLILRNRIIWYFGHGLHANRKFSGRYEVILWFTKSDNYTFNLDAVRENSKYPGKKHYKGPKKGQYSSNPNGKNPSDIWSISLQELDILKRDWLENDIWNIPNVKANHKEKTLHPCQFPIELVERCVLALTNENDWVLDPYSGVGSTIIASLRRKRNVTAVEKEKKYIHITRNRISLLRNNNLPIRELTTPIYDHKKSKLSINPFIEAK